LTSYSLFQRDSDFYKENSVKFNYAILDEAQYIKNFRTKNAATVKEIDSDYRLALSGTPLENSVGEIWSIFEFLMPGFLGTQSEFTKRYITPISKGDKKALINLQKKISFFMMRRLKSDVLEELPEKIEQKIFVDLSPDQKVLYQEILKKIKKDFLSDDGEENFKKSYMHILAALTKLRQVCNHPNLILKEENHKKYHSEKLNIFNDLVEEIISEDRKVLVFSQFTSMLNILESELKEKQISYSRLDGSTKDRDGEINKFNKEKENKVFLISLKAGGVGLNLTSADSVIIFDP
jgi:SNF2 family DNA or RNA helicase